MLEPWKGRGASTELVVRCRLETPEGWLDINDHRHYELHPDSLTGQQVRHRRMTAQSPYVPGSFTVQSVPENVEERVSVWVRGDSHHDMMTALRVLGEAFSQLQYTMEWTLEDHRFYWQCQVADYQVESQREFLHARLSRLTAQVPRTPEVYSEQVLPGTGIVTGGAF